MNIIVLGTNHKYSPIGVRERLSFSKKRLGDALFFLKENMGIDKAVIISTCNRVEIYAATEDADSGLDKLTDFLSVYHEIDRRKVAPYLYRYKGKEAIKHIFEVTSGLDSQIEGETQIQAQVEDFHMMAKKIGFTNRSLDDIFDNAVRISKALHKELGSSVENVSVASAAMALIKKEAGNLRNKKVLIIGTGKVAGLVTYELAKEGCNVILVSNKRYRKAERLARSIGGLAVRFDALEENLTQADIIISATASPHVLVRKTDFELQGKKVLIVDLALPRDVDPEVRKVEGLTLFDLDDLNSVLGKVSPARKAALENGSAALYEKADTLWRRLTGSELEEARSR